MKNLFKKSIKIISIAGILQVVVAEVMAVPLVMIFASYDKTLLDFTIYGFRIYSLAFLVMGFNVWSSSFFTALNNGVISATISFLRTLCFQSATIIILPKILQLNGVWLAIVVAELLSLIVSIAFLLTQKKKYKYI